MNDNKEKDEKADMKKDIEELRKRLKDIEEKQFQKEEPSDTDAQVPSRKRK